MPFFIKTERIKKLYLRTSDNKKEEVIKQHKNWIKSLKSKGINIKSGFLIDENKVPGGGGVLIVECDCYKSALAIVIEDPMIQNNLVNWKLFEWINIFSNEKVI